jgi:hypothetical protein
MPASSSIDCTRHFNSGEPLVFTSGGIKRRVIECKAPVHECRGCGHIFVPERYQRLAKHCHGLMSWVMFEHVAHRISYEMLEEMLREFFGLAVLLRDIVTMIDQHGLKRCHLKKHDRGVAQFFESLAGQSCRSEAAEALRQRLLKNRDKLFTFIQHDGVPWNNNNAENAIKRFAYYREDTIGVMKEAGLNDYLVLLSLCHTCRYRRISFLKFLLSRERDIDAFGTPGRARQRCAVIEVYPKGFVPPHLARLRDKAAQKSGGPTEQIVEEGS